LADVYELILSWSVPPPIFDDIAARGERWLAFLERQEAAAGGAPATENDPLLLCYTYLLQRAEQREAEKREKD